MPLPLGIYDALLFSNFLPLKVHKTSCLQLRNNIFLKRKRKRKKNRSNTLQWGLCHLMSGSSPRVIYFIYIYIFKFYMVLMFEKWGVLVNQQNSLQNPSFPTKTLTSSTSHTATTRTLSPSLSSELILQISGYVFAEYCNRYDFQSLPISTQSSASTRILSGAVHLLFLLLFCSISLACICDNVAVDASFIST